MGQATINRLQNEVIEECKEEQNHDSFMIVNDKKSSSNNLREFSAPPNRLNVNSNANLSKKTMNINDTSMHSSNAGFNQSKILKINDNLMKLGADDCS